MRRVVWLLAAVIIGLLSACAPAQNPLDLPEDRPALLFIYTDN